jgi:hypothetical protein
MSEPFMSGVLLALPLVFAAYFVLISLKEVWITRMLRQRGIITEATITDLHLDAWRGMRNYFAVYEFHATPNTSDEAQTVQQAITRSHFEELQIGQVVMVSYATNDQNIARLTGDDIDMTGRDAPLRRTALLCLVWVGLVGFVFLIK